MEALIAVNPADIGGTQVQTVNARELHAFLEVSTRFNDWIVRRIEEYRFEEGKDFYSFLSSGSSHAKNYHIALDMAKELAMVERNEKGKQARQYFIECERRAKSNVVDLHSALGDPNQLRTMLLAYTEKVIALENKVSELKPKASFYDKVCDAVNGQTVQEVAKILGTGPNRLFVWLRKHSLLMRNNLPYQAHLDNGHFRVVERQYNDARGESHTYTRTLITGKGLAFVQKRFEEEEAA